MANGSGIYVCILNCFGFKCLINNLVIAVLKLSFKRCINIKIIKV